MFSFLAVIMLCLTTLPHSLLSFMLTIHLLLMLHYFYQNITCFSLTPCIRYALMFCLLCSSLYVYINILSYCSRLLVGWQRDIHEFDLEPRQCYVRSTKTLTKHFTCWSKGYSCNFANQVSHSFFLVRWEKRIEHLACEDAIPDVVSLFYLGL